MSLVPERSRGSVRWQQADSCAPGRRLDMVGPGSPDAKASDDAKISSKAIVRSVAVSNPSHLFHAYSRTSQSFGHPKTMGVESAPWVRHDARWLAFSGLDAQSVTGRLRDQTRTCRRAKAVHRVRQESCTACVNQPWRVAAAPAAVRLITPYPLPRPCAQHHLASISHVDNGICSQQRYRPGVS